MFGRRSGRARGALFQPPRVLTDLQLQASAAPRSGAAARTRKRHGRPQAPRQLFLGHRQRNGGVLDRSSESRGQGASRGSGGFCAIRLARLKGSHRKEQRSVRGVEIWQHRGRERVKLGKDEIGNFRPVRDRHILRRRMQLPLRRLGRRRRLLRRRRHHVHDVIAGAPSSRAGSSAKPQPCAPGCRAAAECPCHRPSSRLIARSATRADEIMVASRRQENPHSRPGCRATPDILRRRQRAAGPESGRMARPGKDR